MEQLQPLLNLLSAKYGWTPAFIAWVGALRLALKWVSGPLQTKITQTLADYAKDKEDAQWLHDRILTRPWYRLAAFLLDLFFSIKLPTHSQFHVMSGLAAENATTTTAVTQSNA